MKFLRNLLVGVAIALIVPFLLYFGHRAIGEVVSNVLTRQPLWSVELKANRTPTITDNLVLVTTFDQTNPTGRFHALDKVSGSEKWVSEEPVQKVVAVEDNVIFGSNETRRLMMLDANTGVTQSAFQFADPDIDLLGSAIGGAKGAFILSIDQGLDINRNEVSARTNNQTLWTFTTPSDSSIACEFYEPSDVVTPTVQDGIVVLPILVNPQTEERGYQITALDAATGKELWTWKTSEDFLDDVSVLGDAVYVSHINGGAQANLSWVKALDLKTGEERWSFPIVGKAKLASDREVFIWESDDNNSTSFAVVNKQTGELVRRLSLSREDSREPEAIALANNTIYISDLRIENATWGFYASADNHSWFDAFDATDGHLLWRTPTLMQSHVYKPVVQGDRLFIANWALSNDGKNVVQAYDISQ